MLTPEERGELVLKIQQMYSEKYDLLVLVGETKGGLWSLTNLDAQNGKRMLLQALMINNPVEMDKKCYTIT